VFAHADEPYTRHFQRFASHQRYEPQPFQLSSSAEDREMLPMIGIDAKVHPEHQFLAL